MFTRSKLNQFVVTLFMAGDVMTGRGIDQVLPHPGDPRLFEPCVTNARDYVALAEQAQGPIRAPVDFAYLWGAALAELQRSAPDVRLINLETSITSSPDYWPGKGINYRMHPKNLPVLTAAGIDACALANNHVLDWGYAGLAETLATLNKARISCAGAGENLKEAQAPAILDLGEKGRVILVAFGVGSSGIPGSWAATEKRSGVNLLKDLSEKTALVIANHLRSLKRPGDLLVASIHWGGNWDYSIPPNHRSFARRLIDGAGVDVIHGHSSHHALGIEVYRNKPIIYGCGDFINDYEGISGYEQFRGELGLMYFVSIDSATGKLEGLRMVPTRVRNFRINRASAKDTHWLSDTLNREGRALGTRVALQEDGSLQLLWD